MIDDSPDNCAGAREAGLQAIVYESTTQVIAALDKVLKDVAE
jgi:FMN phosphatase YigB (HAD superfamily)